jgi:hypothetical protein
MLHYALLGARNASLWPRVRTIDLMLRSFHSIGVGYPIVVSILKYGSNSQSVRTPTKTKRLAKLRPVTVAHIRKICSNHDVWSSIFGPTTSAVQLQGSTKFVLEMDQIAPISKGN